MPISPWDAFAKIDSPDGRFSAVFDNAHEIAMGAPTCGLLTISEKTTGRCIAVLHDANASFIWSADSSALAFPRWTRSRKQQLVILRLQDGGQQTLSSEYRLLQLESLSNGVVEGVDSPAYHPVRISIPTGV